MDIKVFIEYDEKGVIQRSSVLQDRVALELVEQLQQGRYALVLDPDNNVEIPDRWWVTDGQLLERSKMVVTVTTASGEATLTGLPDPCEVRCLGDSEVATGGSLTITFDEPGTYTITLKAPPQYLDHTLEVDIP